MNTHNIVRQIKEKIRPGSTKGFLGTSIVDTHSNPSANSRGITPVRKPRSTNWDEVSYPVAVGNKSNIVPIPRGILPRADSEGNLGSYEPDDPEILARFFNIRG